MTSQFTVKEAAYECGVSERTVRRWIEDGELRVVRVHPTKRVRIPASEVERVQKNMTNDDE